jgi:hypothetical protein
MQCKLQEEFPHDPSQIHKGNRTFHVPHVGRVDLQDRFSLEEDFYASLPFECLMYRDMETKEWAASGDWREVQEQLWIGDVSEVMFVCILVTTMTTEDLNGLDVEEGNEET